MTLFTFLDMLAHGDLSFQRELAVLRVQSERDAKRIKAWEDAARASCPWVHLPLVNDAHDAGHSYVMCRNLPTCRLLAAPPSESPRP